MTLNYKESVETLKVMFDPLDEDTIISVLAEQRGNLDGTIEALIKLSSIEDDQASDKEEKSIFSLAGPSDNNGDELILKEDKESLLREDRPKESIGKETLHNDNPDPFTNPGFVIDLNTKYDEDLVKQLQEEEGICDAFEFVANIFEIKNNTRIAKLLQKHEVVQAEKKQEEQMLKKLKELHDNKNKVTVVQGVAIPKDFYKNGELIEPKELQVNEKKIEKKFNAINKQASGDKKRKSIGEKMKEAKQNFFNIFKKKKKPSVDKLYNDINQSEDKEIISFDDNEEKECFNKK